MGKLKQKNMANSIFLKSGITKDWLNKNNFKYNRILSNNEDNVYTYRFPLCKNRYFTTLECELSCIESTGEIRIDVYDYGTKNRYAAFYCAEYGNYSIMLNCINKKINAELKKLGIKSIEGDQHNGC